MSRWCLLTFIIWLSAGMSAVADEPLWTQGIYENLPKSSEAVDISELLKDFSRAQRVPVFIEDGIGGLIKVQYPPLSPPEYLDRLTRDTGLIWYYDGAAIHISTADDLQSEIIPLGVVTPAKLTSILKQLGIYSPRFPITVDEELGLLYVVGPSRYREIIKTVIDGANKRARQQARVQIEMEVFPLKYAWADDQAFIIGNNQVAVPGVATMLRNLLSGGSGNGAFRGSYFSQLPNNLASLRGLGMIRTQNQVLANAQQAAISAQIAASGAESVADTAVSIRKEPVDPGDQDAYEEQLASQVQTVIQADSRTNSIIIRDVHERMETYRQIIEQLDHPTGMVEIKASIIDLDANTGFDLGLPFNAVWNDEGKRRSIQATIDPNTAASVALNPGNLTFTLMDDQVTQFFLNMQALESEGNAKLVSNPSVVTLNNIEAALMETEEIYIRVPGFGQNDLFNITVGTQMYIVPHVVQEPDGRRVKLNVRLEDGIRSTTSTVDEIPVISRNVINTQAVLLEGQSLLLGGLVREEETSSINGVPVLSRIPKIGAAFRETTKVTKRIERIVLLTPRIIDLPTCQGLQYPQPEAFPAPQWNPDEPLPPTPGIEPAPTPGVEMGGSISHTQFSSAEPGQSNLSQWNAPDSPQPRMTTLPAGTVSLNRAANRVEDGDAPGSSRVGVIGESRSVQIVKAQQINNRNRPQSQAGSASVSMRGRREPSELDWKAVKLIQETGRTELEPAPVARKRLNLSSPFEYWKSLPFRSRNQESSP